MNLQDLKKHIPYRWKVQTGRAGQYGGWCVAYVDARDVENLLDEVAGPGNWKDHYEVLGKTKREWDEADKRGTKSHMVSEESSSVKASISIKIGDEWVSKEDVGTASDTEAEKGAFSDAFKRAAVKWGIGRFLYDLDMVWIDLDADGKPIDKSKRRIHDLTEYINGLKPESGVKAAEQKAATNATPAVGIIPPKTTQADGELLGKIQTLVTALGFNPNGKDELGTMVKTMVGLEFQRSNFTEIHDRLKALVTNKEGK